MTLKSVIRFGVTMALLSSAMLAFAADQQEPPVAKNLEIQSDKIYDPDHLSLDSIQSYSKKFTFDWNDYSTIEPNKKQIEEIAAFLKATKPEAYAKLNAADKQTLGKLFYKLGTYYTHVARQPDEAIASMERADTLLTSMEDKAWNDNHLAYAYEQKYAVSDEDADQDKALTYTDKVITKLYHGAKNKEVAFAFCVEGLVQNDAADYAQAETSFKTALAIYEHIPYGLDDQYARAKNRLANIILEVDGRDKEAIAILEELKKYWQTKDNDSHNPYAARNLISLGQAYFKVGNVNDARDQFTKAISIYQTVYGNNNKLLVEPYQLLADTYKKLGNQNLADAYEKKANALDQTNV
jgi:tetratricopeptide (TPR) repeat protein